MAEKVTEEQTDGQMEQTKYKLQKKDLHVERIYPDEECISAYIHVRKAEHFLKALQNSWENSSPDRLLQIMNLVHHMNHVHHKQHLQQDWIALTLSTFVTVKDPTVAGW